ncbi:hypothetical protein [Mycobacterium sp.]|uniref:hypothetical protein n=1 Tax=Mycobacterium sp. TaxID=1785 RepID=UPI001274908E|nr:hypothetical protein [Mycobacterium sp.]KAA8966872.1 MAG: hypothetical protein F6Q13_06820 [Mycobacterium sp.]
MSAASVRERFWEALGSGLSPTAAATVAGVSGNTGRKWARNAGYQTKPEHYGLFFMILGAGGPGETRLRL